MSEEMEELRKIEELEQEDVKSSRWIVELATTIIIMGAMLILMTGCTKRCMWADTNNICKVIDFPLV